MHEVCVVGIGYVGLPTACAFAKSGVDTIGVDVRPKVVALVNEGKSHLTEAGLGTEVKSAVDSGKLHATGDVGAAVSTSAAVIIAVQTPFERGKVKLGFLKSACREVAAAYLPGTTIILESTVPTGTCKRVVIPILESEGRKEGKDFFFAYCPERIAPGNSLREFVSNDRLVGAFSEESFAKAEALLRRAVKGNLTRATVLNAEAAKLVENTARDVYIAFANDLAKLGWAGGWDAREVIRLANTHPRVKILSPGPGVGGPCLTKDPYLLLEGVPAKSHAGSTVRTARKVNDAMHLEVVALLDDAAKLKAGAKVAVLGTAYKPEVGDPRSSPSEPVVKELLKRKLDVTVFDPYCAETFGAKMASTLPDAVRGASCLFLLVAHRAFSSLDVQELAKLMVGPRVVVDAVGTLGAPEPGSDITLRRLGDGSTRKPRRSRGK